MNSQIAAIFNEQELDRFGIEWCKLNSDYDEARRISLKQNIFWQIYSLSYQMYCGRLSEEAASDIAFDFMKGRFKTFNSEKGTLTHFSRSQLVFTKKDYEKKINHHVSLDQAIVSGDSENDENMYALIKDSESLTPEEEYIDRKQSEWHVSRFVMLIMDLKSHISGRQNNETRLYNYRLFYTDRMSWIIKEEYTENRYLKTREQDIIRTLDMDFLDYILTKVCKSLKEIFETERKRYIDIIKDKENVKASYLEPLKCPLPPDIFIKYLKERGFKASASGLSDYMKGFNDLIKSFYLKQS